MKKCEGCGARIDPRETSCPYCGSIYNIEKSSEKPQQPIYNAQNFQPSEQSNSSNASSIRALIPGIIMFFIFPPIGFIMIFIAAMKIAKKSRDDK